MKRATGEQVAPKEGHMIQRREQDEMAPREKHEAPCDDSSAKHHRMGKQMQLQSNGLPGRGGGAGWKHILQISPLLLLVDSFESTSAEHVGQLFQQVAEAVHRNQLLVVMAFVCLTMREMIRALVRMA